MSEADEVEVEPDDPRLPLEPWAAALGRRLVAEREVRAAQPTNTNRIDLTKPATRREMSDVPVVRMVGDRLVARPISNRTFARWLDAGGVPIEWGDRLATAIGLRPEDVWPEWAEMIDEHETQEMSR